ncbi:MAG: PKD-like family lipoprotein [Bacteroidales bacterium]
MKQIAKYIFTIIFSIYLTGCIKDTGNYEYKDPKEITPILVSGIEDSYSAISLEKLIIDPLMESNESLYDYVWYAYPGLIVSTTCDTLGKTKKLEYPVTLMSGTYQLVFKATHKVNKTSVYKKSVLTVSSIFGIGYYINKYENGRTDIDFIDRNGLVNKNILKQINGDDLPGKPIRSTYEVNRYSYNVTNPDGTKTRIAMKPALMVCTDEDLRIYHGENMKLLKKWDEAFLEKPAVKKPQGVWANTVGFMLMNDNAVSFVYNNGSNVGEFGYSYPVNGMKLNPNVAVMSGSHLVYDDNAGELAGYYVQTYYPVKNAVIKASPLTLGPVGQAYFTNCDLIYMGTQNYQATSAGRTYVIVKNRSTNVHYLWQIGTSNIQYGYIYDYGAGGMVIPAGTGVVNGKVFALKGGASTALNTVIYYSSGDNKVHYYNPANQTERRDLITLPAGEEITHIEHCFDNYYKVNTFTVLSNKGGNWTLRTYDFEGSTPDVLLPERNTYNGTGLAKNMIYRHANTSITY